MAKRSTPIRMRPPAKDEKIHSYYQVLGLALKELLIEKGIVTPAEIRAGD